VLEVGFFCKMQRGMMGRVISCHPSALAFFILRQLKFIGKGEQIMKGGCTGSPSLIEREGRKICRGRTGCNSGFQSIHILKKDKIECVNYGRK
jgi:hypothetical protein